MRETAADVATKPLDAPGFPDGVDRISALGPSVRAQTLRMPPDKQNRCSRARAG
jgi:hypothetical protein